MAVCGCEGDCGCITKFGNSKIINPYETEMTRLRNQLAECRRALEKAMPSEHPDWCKETGKNSCTCGLYEAEQVLSTPSPIADAINDVLDAVEKWAGSWSIPPAQENSGGRSDVGLFDAHNKLNKLRKGE